MVEAEMTSAIDRVAQQRFISVSKKLLQRRIQGKDPELRRNFDKGITVNITYQAHTGELRELHTSITYSANGQEHQWEATLMHTPADGVYFGTSEYSPDGTKITKHNDSLPASSREQACNSILRFMEFVVGARSAGEQR